VISQILLPLALSFIMFAMGLTMTLADLRAVLVRPRALLAGLASKLALVPLLGLAAAYLFGLSGDFAAGLIILAACPAGVTSSLLTHHAKGRIALAAMVTAISSLGAVVSLPLIANLGLRLFAGFEQPVDLPVGKMVLGIFLVDTLPLALGLALQAWAPRLAARLGRFARPLATFLFALIVAGAFINQMPAMLAHGAVLLPATLALNIAAMAGGWLTARAFRLSSSDGVAVVMENGLQNSALGIFVAVTLLQNEAMMAPSIVYALAMNLTALLLIAWRKRAEKALVQPS
jgi:BASS family bile acid:Na+ symporter